MFAQIASERGLPACPIVIDVGGKLTCDIQEMQKLIKQVNFVGKLLCVMLIIFGLPDEKSG